ncbi:MAG: hypothetical protein A3F54_05465 [Candidatus Kerfeldbacteria bacterium RIFCSPHIGHO2_12_FULL_48_17]|uniref:Uncharacterized protein n=1 Tax=Candidatus Kerfeldbacteria bacterium RIFCSPHIGHO2_12_FULL_48_17 TaxID=1798542 RepID=A0A1G2B8H7_9BACT|nr:MAG: hypothetical protein A3F54_05465 [Candidatus Kerfeldbacteria bacterium RIFCSPHIGHO2_12_FULL_48_17]
MPPPTPNIDQQKLAQALQHINAAYDEFRAKIQTLRGQQDDLVRQVTKQHEQENIQALLSDIKNS